jgi:hypothetical protein
MKDFTLAFILLGTLVVFACAVPLLNKLLSRIFRSNAESHADQVGKIAT